MKLTTVHRFKKELVKDGQVLAVVSKVTMPEPYNWIVSHSYTGKRLVDARGYGSFDRQEAESIALSQFN